MLDLKVIRDNPEAVQESIRLRGLDAAAIDVDRLLALDAERRDLQGKTEALQAERNATSKQIPKLQGDAKQQAVERVRQVKEELAGLEQRAAALTAERDRRWALVPNLLAPDVPRGGEADAKELRRWGSPRPAEGCKDHVELGVLTDTIDFDRAAKVTGPRFYYLKHEAVLLEQALIALAMRSGLAHGFVPVATPDLARDAILHGIGFAPRGPETQVYSVEGAELSLVGTAEITLGGYHSDEVLDAARLPLRYLGLSHCYRTEAGTYGKASKGLYRVHQFTKAELFVICRPGDSAAEHERILGIEEELCQALGLPYRVLLIAAGDLGAPAFKKYDLEAWMPGRADYGEVTSCSNCTDYQARRLAVRFKEGGKPEVAHMLNGTAIAVSRTLIALYENYQEPDGSIRIPPVLVPFMHGIERIPRRV